MRFLPGTVSLGSIQGGTLGSGVVPFPRITRTSLRNSNNAGSIGAAPTQINSIDCGTVVTGDYILGFATVQSSKGVTGGKTTINLDQGAGTAVVEVGGLFLTSANVLSPQAASVIDVIPDFVIFHVTTGGTFTLRLTGSSAGSNANMVCDLVAIVFPNS